MGNKDLSKFDLTKVVFKNDSNNRMNSSNIVSHYTLVFCPLLTWLVVVLFLKKEFINLYQEQKCHKKVSYPINIIFSFHFRQKTIRILKNLSIEHSSKFFKI